MKDFRDRSKKRFEDEMSKMLHDMMVSCLDRAEKILGDDVSDDTWDQFRFNILNLGNDKIRLLKERLQDYSIEFRPSVFSVKYNVGVPADKLVTFFFTFTDKGQPLFAVETNSDAAEVLKSGLGCGLSSPIGPNLVRFEVEGMYDIFNRVIPFLDQNQCLKGATLVKYGNWKEKVYNMEKGTK